MPTEIAKALKKTPLQITQLSNRHGWPAKRREMEDQAERDGVEAGLDSAKEFVANVDLRSGELAEKGFNMATKTSVPKDFADAMRGTKIAVDLKRQALGLDLQTDAVNISLTAIFARPLEAPAPRVVVPVIELDFDDGLSAELSVAPQVAASASVRDGKGLEQ